MSPKSTARTLAVVVFTLAIGLSAVSWPAASQPQEEARATKPVFRTWTDATGTFKVEAALVGVKDDKVLLKKKETGTVITIPIDRVSRADREYLGLPVSQQPTKEPAEKQPLSGGGQGIRDNSSRQH